jgi:hypothetical protein
MKQIARGLPVKEEKGAWEAVLGRQPIVIFSVYKKALMIKNHITMLYALLRLKCYLLLRDNIGVANQNKMLAGAASLRAATTK